MCEKDPFRDLIYQFKLMIDEAIKLEAEAEIETEKSCMTPQDCEECGNGCDLYKSILDPSTVTVTIPKALDLEDFVQKPSEETLDGIRRSEQTNKYNRLCIVCNLVRVHDHSSSGVCPDCAAEIRTRISEKGIRGYDEIFYDGIVEQMKAEKGN